MKIKNFIRRAGMSLLFISALFVTASSISNLTLADLKVWAQELQMDRNSASTASTYRELNLKEKNLNIEKPMKRLISNDEIEGPETLEDAIDFEQYPTKSVMATGYTAGIESTGKTEEHPQYGITYSGVKVKRDLYSTIAADTSVFPIGTILFIPGYGYGVVADTGSAIKGNKIDLYYHTVDDVFSNWGKKQVDVYIIEYGDGSLTEEDLIELNENEALQVFREQIVEG